MAEPSRYTPEQLSILLRIAAGKLGRDPVKLQEELQNGRLDGLLQSGRRPRKGKRPALRPGGPVAAAPVSAGTHAAAAAFGRAGTPGALI